MKYCPCSLILCLAAVSQLIVHAETAPTIHRASLWGGPERDVLAKAHFQANGMLLLVGTHSGEAPAGIPQRSIDGSNSAGHIGSIIRYHPQTNAVIEEITFPRWIIGIKEDKHGHIYLRTSYGIEKLDARLSKVLWQVSGGGHTWTLTQEGEVYFARGGTVHRVGRDGKMLGTFSINGGYRPKSIAWDDVNQQLFAIGVHAQSNLFWPWLLAVKNDGTKVYERWNWSKKDAWTGGTADSHLDTVKVINGKVLLMGSSDGNPTTFDRDPRDVHVVLPKTIPNVNFGYADPATSRAIAWFGVMDAKAGTIESRGRVFTNLTVPRTNKDGKTWMKTLAASTRINDMTIGADGRLYLVGYVRGAPRWTASSPHKQVGPPTWRGNWGNPDAPRDPVLIIVGKDRKKIEYLASFAQGDTDLYSGVFDGVAVSPKGCVVAVGKMTQPGTELDDKTKRYNSKRPQWKRGPPEHYFHDKNKALAPQETVYLHKSLQPEWGGMDDGYMVILGGEVSTDPLAFVRVSLDVVEPEAQEHLAKLRAASSFAAEVQALQAAIADQRLSGAALRGVTQALAIIDRLGQRFLLEADSLRATDPASTLDKLRTVAQMWKGLAAGDAADATLAALQDDDAFEDAQAAQELWQDYRQAEAALKMPALDKRAAKDAVAVSASYLDMRYNKLNNRALNAMRRYGGSLVKKYPDSHFAKLAQQSAQRLAIPLTTTDVNAAKAYLGLAVMLDKLKTTSGKAHLDNPAFAKANKRSLPRIVSAWKAMHKKWPDGTATRQAEVVLASYGIIPPPATAAKQP